VQSGFCRTGDWFASDHEGVVPDLITTAKGIAGGMPLAAVTGRAELMDAVHPGGLGGTYGGNPVACAAALAAIESMREPTTLLRGLARSATSSPTVSAASRRVRRGRRGPRSRRDDRDRARHRRREQGAGCRAAAPSTRGATSGVSSP
jgi:4-aminobutyrate aminotransferase/(S)-3-amino-2-methylpropionate transaminase